MSPERTSRLVAAVDGLAGRRGPRRRCRAAAPGRRRRHAVERVAARPARRPRRAARARAAARPRAPSRPSAGRASGAGASATAERIRVPSPPAITTAAIGRRSRAQEMAGAPGFEPGIAGPKPAALPLGYAPLGRGDESSGGRGGHDSATTREEDERDDRDRRSHTSTSAGTRTTASCETAKIQVSLAHDVAARRAGRGGRRARARRSRAGRRPTSDRADEDEDALDDREQERELDAVVAQHRVRSGCSPCSIVTGGSIPNGTPRSAVPGRNGEPGSAGAAERASAPPRRARRWWKRP